MLFVYIPIGPDFHNGAASGLRVGFSSPSPIQTFYTRFPYYQKHNHINHSSTSSSVVVTRNWILYNRTHAQSTNRQSAHAGLLLALGLQGHLKSLTVNDICEYLTQGHEPTTVAILLGE